MAFVVRRVALATIAMEKPNAVTPASAEKADVTPGNLGLVGLLTNLANCENLRIILSINRRSLQCPAGQPVNMPHSHSERSPRSRCARRRSRPIAPLRNCASRMAASNESRELRHFGGRVRELRTQSRARRPARGIDNGLPAVIEPGHL